MIFKPAPSTLALHIWYAHKIVCIYFNIPSSLSAPVHIEHYVSWDIPLNVIHHTSILNSSYLVTQLKNLEYDNTSNIPVIIIGSNFMYERIYRTGSLQTQVKLSEQPEQINFIHHYLGASTDEYYYWYLASADMPSIVQLYSIYARAGLSVIQVQPYQWCARNTYMYIFQSCMRSGALIADLQRWSTFELAIRESMIYRICTMKDYSIIDRAIYAGGLVPAFGAWHNYVSTQL